MLSKSGSPWRIYLLPLIQYLIVFSIIHFVWNAYSPVLSVLLEPPPPLPSASLEVIERHRQWRDRWQDVVDVVPFIVVSTVYFVKEVTSISTRLLYRLCFPDSQEHNLSLARSTDVASTDLSSTPILSLQAAKTYIDIPSIYKEHQGRLEKEVAELQELYKGELKKGNTQKEGLQKENAVDTCKHDVHQCCRALSQCQNPKHDDSISPLSGIKQQMSTAIINYHIPTPFAQVPLEWNPSYLQLPVSQTSVHVQQSRPISSTSARTSLSLLSSSVNNTSARPSTSPSTPRSIIHKPRVSIGRADSIIDSLKKRSSLESSRVFVIPRIRAITPEETINIPATRLANFQCDPGPHGDVHLTIEESHGDIQRVLKHSYKLSCAPQPGISNTDFYTHLRDRLAYWHEIDVCIIADGYSNTGKSHTLFAVEDSLLPSLATDIFLSKHDNVKVSCSAVELYLDKFWDLLNLGDTTKKYPKKYPVELELVSHRTTKFALKDVKFVEVSSPHELVKYAQMATKRRHTRETKRNSSSSRGQLVFKVRLESDDFESREITLVDLVGAERDDDLLATKDPTNLSFEEKKFNNICRGNLSTYLKLYAEYKQPGSKVENLVPNSLFTKYLHGSLGKPHSIVIYIANVSSLQEDEDKSMVTLGTAVDLQKAISPPYAHQSSAQS